MMKKIVLILIIFTLFCFFRLKNIEKRIGFGWDQEQYTTQVRQLVKEHKPVLIGPRVNNDKGFFLAPYFTYLITPFYLATNLHPNAILYFIIFFNLLFFFLSFFLIKSIFKEYFTYLFLTLWAINPLLAGYDTTAWWPIWIPLGVIATWWLLNRIYHKNSPILWIILGLNLGFFFNMHFQFVIVVLFSIIFLLASLKSRKNNISHFILLAGSFIITFLPLFIFDLRHDFLNIKLFFGFITQNSGGAGADYLAWLPVFNNLIKPLIIVASDKLTVVFYILTLIVLFYLYRVKTKFFKTFYLSSIFLWIVFPVIFAKYGKRPSEYYFVFLYPFIYISIIDLIAQLPKKLPLLLFTLLIPTLFITNLNPLLDRLKPDYFSLYYMDKLIKDFAPFTKGKKFNISFGVPVGGDSGYRYLFDYYQIKQTGDWSDPLIRLVRPSTKECHYKSEAAGIIIPPELR